MGGSVGRHASSRCVGSKRDGVRRIINSVERLDQVVSAINTQLEQLDAHKKDVEYVHDVWQGYASNLAVSLNQQH